MVSGKLIRTIAVLLCILCQPTETFSQESKSSKHLYIVFQAGFSGCSPDLAQDPYGSSIFQPFTKSLWLLAAKGVSFDFSVACFPFDLSPSHMRYYLPETPQIMRERTISTYDRQLSDSIERSNADEVFVVGHSHGAWLAMQMILKNSFTNRPLHLYTVDAISLRQCSPTTFIKNLFINSIPAGPTAKECTRFPADFWPSELGTIKDSIRSWKNFYQTEFHYLKSGPTYATFNNTKVKVGGGLLDNQHVLINNSPIIWFNLRKEIETSAGIP